jgi:hypothetical protein
MFNSGVLDVAIGVIFVYLLLGLMCTTVNEWIAQLFKTRAVTLKEAIRGLLHAPPDGFSGIRAVDINVDALAKRFSKADDKLTLAVGPFDADLRADVDRYAAALGKDPAPSPPSDLAARLAGKLTDALDQPDLNKKIDDSKVTQETRTELGKQPKDNDLRRLNRALLNEAYPDEITSLSDAFYSHPLIKSLARSGEHPSYLPAKTFALTLMDILSKGQAAAGGAEDRLAKIKSSIASLPDSDVKTSLQALLRTSSESVDVQKTIEQWFDDSMDRVSGWYKKRTQVWTIIIASIVTIFANADTIGIAQKLMINPALRAKIVEEAAASAKSDKTTSSPLTEQQKADLSSLTGWTEEFRTFNRLEVCKTKKETLGDRLKCAQSKMPDDLTNDEKARWDMDSFPGWDLFSSALFPWIWAIVPRHLLGWVLTAIAASLGAPFWFDTLNKFMNIRSAGTAPNEKKTDKSKA